MNKLLELLAQLLFQTRKGQVTMTHAPSLGRPGWRHQGKELYSYLVGMQFVMFNDGNEAKDKAKDERPKRYKHSEDEAHTEVDITD